MVRNCLNTDNCFTMRFQGNSPQAMSLAKGIQQKMLELQDKCARAVSNTEHSGVRRPAHTIAGKLEQAQRWLTNPAVDDKGLGWYGSVLAIYCNKYYRGSYSV